MHHSPRPKLLLLIVALAFAFAFALVSCTPPASPPPASTGKPVTLNVFAAASLTDAFTELAANYTAAHPNTQIVYNFAGSNQLATQLVEGAPADIFASANRAQMQAAIAAGRIVSGTEQTFARNRLVVVTPSDNPADLTDLADLARPGVKLVFAAPEVPIGQYALAFLAKAGAAGSFGAGYQDAVLANIVSYEENVRSVLAKITLGEADAGIVYTSDAAASGANVEQLAIPDDLNTVAHYPIAVVADTPYPDQAGQFVAYVLSPEGQSVLAAHGFLPATEP